MYDDWLQELFATKNPLQARLDNLRPASQTDASFTVNAKATYYPYFTQVFVPNTPWRKLEAGRQAQQKRSRKVKPVTGHTEDTIERSLRRSKKSVRDYVNCNRFELFVTFTFNADRHDLDKCRAKLHNWLKNQQKRYGTFLYLIVPELHKDGALHFHAFFKDYNGALAEAINPKTGTPLKRHTQQIYNLPGYTLGFTDVIKITDSYISHAKTASYVRKYITKDMPLFAGKKRYWPSKGLQQPTTENNPTWYEAEKPDKTYTSEYGITYFYLNRSVIPERFRVPLFTVQTLPGLLEQVEQLPTSQSPSATNTANAAADAKLPRRTSNSRRTPINSPHGDFPVNSQADGQSSRQVGDSRGKRPDTEDVQ